MDVDARRLDIETYDKASRLRMIRRRRQVLIVDTDITQRTELTTTIQKFGDGINVVSLDTPEQVFNWLENNHPDIIITNYQLPHIDGIELTRKIRSNLTWHDIPIMIITLATEKTVRVNALDAGVTAFLTRPIDAVECRSSCRNLLKLHEQQSIIQDRADWLTQQVELGTEKVVSRERETLLRLIKAGECRDEETGFHVVRVGKYAVEIATALGLNKSDCDEIEYATLMHDIGKIGIPDNILKKPGKLTSDEWEQMKRHTQIGHDILSGSQSHYIQTGALIALNHHERLDGSGYPSGLSGKDIPLAARIAAVADVFDSLVSTRAYKSGWTNEDAFRYLKDNSGILFDPECVDGFFERLENVLRIQNAMNSKIG